MLRADLLEGHRGVKGAQLLRDARAGTLLPLYEVALLIILARRERQGNLLPLKDLNLSHQEPTPQTHHGHRLSQGVGRTAAASQEVL